MCVHGYECVLFWSVSVCMHAAKDLNVEKSERGNQMGLGKVGILMRGCEEKFNLRLTKEITSRVG